MIDSEEDLIKDFEGISLAESRAVLCVHMLCYVLDGSISWSELKLWHTMLDRVEKLHGSEKEQVTFKAMLIPDVVCQQFRYNQPVTTDMLMGCFDPEQNAAMRKDAYKPVTHWWREFTFKVLIVLTAEDPFVACRDGD